MLVPAVIMLPVMELLPIVVKLSPMLSWAVVPAESRLPSSARKLMPLFSIAVVPAETMLLISMVKLPVTLNRADVPVVSELLTPARK